MAMCMIWCSQIPGSYNCDTFYLPIKAPCPEIYILDANCMKGWLPQAHRERIRHLPPDHTYHPAAGVHTYGQTTGGWSLVHFVCSQCIQSSVCLYLYTKRGRLYMLKYKEVISVYLTLSDSSPHRGSSNNRLFITPPSCGHHT